MGASASLAAIQAANVTIRSRCALLDFVILLGPDTGGPNRTGVQTFERQ
jgi:hypothetical protein